MSEGATVAVETPKVKRNRKTQNLVLVKVDSTVGAGGGDVPCLVVFPFPPDITDKQRRSRAGIRAAINDAVYKQSLIEYANTSFNIIAVGDEFRAKAKSETITRLVPVRDE